VTHAHHTYAVVRRMDGRLTWKYAAGGFAPDDALYVTSSLSLAEAFIRQEEAVEREKADREKRDAIAQGGLWL
jgi:hypothetical protein